MITLLLLFGVRCQRSFVILLYGVFFVSKIMFQQCHMFYLWTFVSSVGNFPHRWHHDCYCRCVNTVVCTCMSSTQQLLILLHCTVAVWPLPLYFMITLHDCYLCMIACLFVGQNMIFLQMRSIQISMARCLWRPMWSVLIVCTCSLVLCNGKTTHPQP